MRSQQPQHRRLLGLLLVLLCWILSSTVVAGQDGGVENCPLDCKNGSTCQEGDASFEGHPTDADGKPFHKDVVDIRNYHCACPEGFTGVTCAIPFESCADERDNHVCYHGGTCILGFLDDDGNNQYHCDCSSATEANVDSPSDNKTYVGNYCEYEQETTCGKDDDQPQQNPSAQEGASSFCVNEGVCKNNDDSIHNGGGEAPCTCGEEYAGAHCEYRSAEIPTTSCDLNCQNGGSCQLGIGGDTDDNKGDFNYCLCPPQSHGNLCENDLGTPCGINTCYHGSECVRGANDGGLYCDCSTAVNVPGKHYAGPFCQYEATNYCGDTQDYFCVNSGSCVDQGNGWVYLFGFWALGTTRERKSGLTFLSFFLSTPF
jgi:Notch-like protein